jgi:HAD superfamily hydrolase (TIGR01509 family)
MKLKGILFDFDGVVLDSMKQHVAGWQYAFKQQGVELTELDIYLMEGMGVKAVVKNVCDKYKIPQEIASVLMKIKTEFYKQHLQIEFYYGFFKLLDYLKSQKLKMAVVTGGDRSRIIPFAQEHLNGYFKGFVCSDDVRETKPSPEPYLKGLEILELDANKCLVIENAPLGIKSAKAAGIKTIAIETTLDKSYLQQADFIVQSFPEVQSVVEKYISTTENTKDTKGN